MALGKLAFHFLFSDLRKPTKLDVFERTLVDSRFSDFFFFVFFVSVSFCIPSRLLFGD